MRALLVLGLLAGCDRLLGLGTIAPLSDAHAPGDASDASDASLDGGVLITCLSDSFSSLMIDSLVWMKFSNAASPVPQVAQLSGVVQVGILAETPPTPPYNGLLSVAAYSFDDATFQVRLVMLPTDPNAAIRLYAMIDQNNGYEVTIQGTSLALSVVANSGRDTSGAIFDPSSDHYVRLRSGSGSVAVDVGATAGAWAQLLEKPASVPTAMLAVGFAAGVEPPGTSSTQTVQFDDALLQTSRCN